MTRLDHCMSGQHYSHERPSLSYYSPLALLVAIITAAAIILAWSVSALASPAGVASHTSGTASSTVPASYSVNAAPERVFAGPSVWWVAPVAGARCSSPRGWRWGDWHAGRDLLRYSGAPVRAVANGTVIAAGWSGGTNGGWGYRVVLLHGKHTYSTLYAHGLKGSITVHVGQWVRMGTVIMRMGSSGWSTGTHTHFGVYTGRYAPGGDINPDRFMAQRGVKLCT